jgi:hypothetical protein
MDFLVKLTDTLSRATWSRSLQSSADAVIEGYLFKIRTWPTERRALMRAMLRAALDDVLKFRIVAYERARMARSHGAKSEIDAGTLSAVRALPFRQPSCPHCGGTAA